MTDGHLCQQVRQPGAPIAVAAPHPADAVGRALRNAFSTDRSLPSELAAALLRLDRCV